MGCWWQRLCRHGVNYEYTLFHFHLIYGSFCSFHWQLNHHVPVGPKIQLGRSCAAVGLNQLSKHTTSRGAKANVVQPTNSPTSRTQWVNKWLNTWIFKKKHKNEEIISQNTSKHTNWSAHRGWRQLDTCVERRDGADKWTQVSCIKVRLGIRCSNLQSAEEKLAFQGQ